MQTVIQSIEQSQLISIDWAREKNKDLIQASEFSEIWFKTTIEENRNSQILILSLEIFFNQKEENHALWSIASDKDWQRNSEWNIETVRHLALINIAALTGASALLATKVIDPYLSKYSLLFFLVGLLFSVADFYFCSCGYEKRALKFSRLAHSIKKSKSHNEVSQAISNTKFEKEIYFKVAFIFGIGSIAAFVLGTLLLAYVLLEMI